MDASGEATPTLRFHSGLERSLALSPASIQWSYQHRIGFREFHSIVTEGDGEGTECCCVFRKNRGMAPSWQSARVQIDQHLFI